MAAILAARKLAQHDGGRRVPATVTEITDAVRWAEEIIADNSVTMMQQSNLFEGRDQHDALRL